MQMNQIQKKRNCKHKQQIQKVKYPEHVRCAGADEDCSSATEETTGPVQQAACRFAALPSWDKTEVVVSHVHESQQL